VFIINVLGLFSTTLLKSAPGADTISGTNNSAANAAAASFGAFTSLNIEFLNVLVMTVAIVLTVGNAMVTSVVSGGHRLRMAFSFSTMCLISGLLMAVLPGMASSVFETITATP
jgi:archaellum biogenesis protein FlaJ (TadC family)